MHNVAVVICTYNPNTDTFKKVISAISELIVPQNISVEYCIVDNNNNTLISDLPFIKSLINKVDNAKVICEKKQGLSFARMAGVNATSAPAIVFFDDDNAPEPHFITNLLTLLKEHPEVGVWGPGKVTVKFSEKVDPWISSYKWLFQERDNKKVEFGKEQRWTTYYPPGTGQVVKRDILQHYIYLLENNLVSLTDRKGNNLSSGGDAQIVYTAIKLGYCAGISPGLVVNHLIDKKRTDINYVKKLTFSIMATGATSNVEIFPEQKSFYALLIKSQPQIFFKLFSIAGSSIRDRSAINFKINTAFYLGQIASSYQVCKGYLPAWLSFFIKILKLQ